MNTKSTASKTISFKMKDQPHRSKDKSADYANHTMAKQIHGSKKSQEHQEDNGCA
jgi:hypothetical protein